MLPRKIHFVGIGGIGMSALAKVLLEDGHDVSGSDLQLPNVARRLAAAGAIVVQGHNPANVAGAELVVVTSAVRQDNPELVAARSSGIPIIKRSELLGRLMTERRGIAIAGTHGKTTTSAMVSLILLGVGLDPTIIVGGEIRGLETNARRGGGPWLVCEADEFDGSFLRLAPEISVITNVEADHLDFYGSLDAIEAAFREFADRASGSLILCYDDPFLRLLGQSYSGGARVVSYGLDNAAEWQALGIRPNARGGNDFRVERAGRPIGDVSLGFPGNHNVANGLAAIAAVFEAGVDGSAAMAALTTFGGVHRRLEIKGVVNGVTVIDDYGHHPTEIKATLAALRQRYPGRPIVCLFQPHTYSRTKLLLEEFAGCFGDADRLRVLDIYAARERDEWGITAQDLVAAIVSRDVKWVGAIEDAVDQLVDELAPDEVLLTIGAGDVYRAGELVLARLASNE